MIFLFEYVLILCKFTRYYHDLKVHCIIKWFAIYSKFGVTRPNLVWLSDVCIYVTIYLDQYTMLFQMFFTFRHEIFLFTVGFLKLCLHAFGMVDSCGRILLYKDLLFFANQYWFSQAMVQRKWRMVVSIYWPLWQT
jgi:hypothetical protein